MSCILQLRHHGFVIHDAAVAVGLVVVLVGSTTDEVFGRLCLETVERR